MKRRNVGPLTGQFYPVISWYSPFLSVRSVTGFSHILHLVLQNQSSHTDPPLVLTSHLKSSYGGSARTVRWHWKSHTKKGERVFEIFPVRTASINYAKCEQGRASVRWRHTIPLYKNLNWSDYATFFCLYIYIALPWCCTLLANIRGYKSFRRLTWQACGESLSHNDALSTAVVTQYRVTRKDKMVNRRHLEGDKRGLYKGNLLTRKYH